MLHNFVQTLYISYFIEHNGNCKPHGRLLNLVLQQNLVLFLRYVGGISWVVGLRTKICKVFGCWSRFLRTARHLMLYPTVHYIIKLSTRGWV